MKQLKLPLKLRHPGVVCKVKFVGNYFESRGLVLSIDVHEDDNAVCCEIGNGEVTVDRFAHGELPCGVHQELEEKSDSSESVTLACRRRKQKGLRESSFW